jgi:catechol 2,3-dioxygenase-like lactoylglutathione lyase family enzyme
MFSHIMIGANDVAASKKFYDATLAVLGHKPGVMDENGRCFYFTDNGIFALTKPIDGEAASHGNGTTIGFAAADTAAADAWHQAGLANGGTDCEDPPGVREGAAGKLYLAYLRDPSGNKVCTLHRLA